MTQPMPRYLVQTPDVTPWRYGLRSVASLLTTDLATASDEEKRWTARGVEYESVNCYTAHEWLGDACELPPPAATVTVTFTAAPSAGDTIVSASAVHDTGAVRQINIQVAAGTPVGILSDGLPASAVYTQSPSAAATLAVTITDAATGTTMVHSITLSLAGAVTAGGTAELVIPLSKAFTDTFAMIGSGAFTLYAEDGCKILGSQQESANRARAKLLAGEQAAVERVVMRTVIAPAATDLTTVVGGHELKDALGILEQYAAANYGGMAFLHVPRLFAPYMTDIGYVHRDGAVLRTILDSAVAFGGGYDGQISPAVPSVAPAAGDYWIYVTGQPVYRQTSVDVPAPTAAQGGANLLRNQLTILAEKTVSVTVDCLRAGILVDLVPGA
jgi:hypothetical protein